MGVEVIQVVDAPFKVSPVVDVMGMPLWALDRSGLIDLLVDRALTRVSSRVCYVNAHSWCLARRDPAFYEVLATADILYADGMSLVWASRLLGVPLPARLSSADYIEDFARTCARRGAAVFLLGGLDGVADRAARRLVAKVPELRVAGTCGGYFDLTDSGRVIDQINDARPDLLLVGMGSPRQEQWSAEHRDALSAPVIWSVGALFDYLAGVERRAPQWMCRSGLEWVFRLAMDPLGKGKRYLVENPLFAGSLLKGWLQKGRSAR